MIAAVLKPFGWREPVAKQTSRASHGIVAHASHAQDLIALGPLRLSPGVLAGLLLLFGWRMIRDDMQVWTLQCAVEFDDAP